MYALVRAVVRESRLTSPCKIQYRPSRQVWEAVYLLRSSTRYQGHLVDVERRLAALCQLPGSFHLYEYLTRSGHYHLGLFEDDATVLETALDALRECWRDSSLRLVHQVNRFSTSGVDSVDRRGFGKNLATMLRRSIRRDASLSTLAGW